MPELTRRDGRKLSVADIMDNQLETCDQHKIGRVADIEAEWRDDGKLVLTNLGRLGSPLLRYRTGDLVRVDPRPCPCGRKWLRLDGGILGRTDDMIAIRGNNFYPSALENVLRRFAEVVEFRVTIDRSSPLAEMRIEIEAGPSANL